MYKIIEGAVIWWWSILVFLCKNYYGPVALSLFGGLLIVATGITIRVYYSDYKKFLASKGGDDETYSEKNEPDLFVYMKPDNVGIVVGGSAVLSLLWLVFFALLPVILPLTLFILSLLLGAYLTKRRLIERETPAVLLVSPNPSVRRVAENYVRKK